jgi:hypothetical protein
MKSSTFPIWYHNKLIPFERKLGPIQRIIFLSAFLSLVQIASSGANIAPLGSAILGVNNDIDSDAGTPRAQAGVLANINDDDVGTHVDNWFGVPPTDGGQGVSFVGILWPTVRYDQIETLTLYFTLFGDGGWFGTNGVGPGADGTLTSDYLIEPTVQVTTDRGVTWTTVPHTSDYLTALNGVPIGGPSNGSPLQATATFTLTTPATLVNGVRVIGRNGGEADGNGFIGIFEMQVNSNPTADTDSDGLPDSWETANGLVIGTNDSALDPDSDGLSNLQEFNASTNPKQADTDGDGLNDGAEVNTNATNPLVPDTDGDGLSDGAEVNTHHTDPKLADTDADGLNDNAEVTIHHTNPTLADSDNDGYPDGLEISQGSDPNDPTSLPNNLAVQGHGLLGVKQSVDSGPETEVERYHVGTAQNINDGNQTSRVDTWNGDDPATVSYTASFVGIRWDAPITNAVASLKLTLATFLDGGWFGRNNVGPGGGGALTAAHLTEPRVEITLDGTAWSVVPHTSDYISALTGHRVGGGTVPNPSYVTATFTLTQPTNNIVGIRIVGSEGGTASGGFIGVSELSALSSSTDVDNDGMDDAWERQNGLAVGTNDAAGDPDSDSLTNLQEFDADTNPKVADTDGDGLTDGAEVNQYHTNPIRADTDADGLSDGAEINTYNTSPFDKDSDSDHFSDGIEVAQGTDPAKASSFPDNIAPIGTAIIGTRESVESGEDIPWANAGSATAINDFDLTTRVDTYNGDGNPNTASYVGILWDLPIGPVPIVKLDLSLATFFDGGWFGVNGIGPGAGAVLSAADHLVAPIVQVSSDHGTNWQTVAATSDYIDVFDGHPLPAVAFGDPTIATARFVLTEPQRNVNGIRLIGTEGGTASGGFLGVFELAVRIATNAPPQGLTLLNPTISGGQFRFQFDSLAGTNHVVQYKNELTDATWQTLQTIPGDGTRKEVTDNPNAVPHRFYRVSN